MEKKNPMKSLNPNAPEFSPAFTRNPKLYHPSPTPPIFYFNKPFPYHTKLQKTKPFPYQTKLQKNKTFPYQTKLQTSKPFPYNTKPWEASTSADVKPGKSPFRNGFCNKRCLPPRLLKKFSSEKFVPLPENKLAGKTSVMVKNIPNCLGRTDLLRILDNHCRKHNRESSYDFLYLPMDFVKRANLGYAFVNFTASVAAERFRREFENFSWGNLGYRKVCEITMAKYQGKEELTKHFKDSMFTCHTDNYLPVVLSPPSDGFTGYTLTTLGDRVGLRGGGSRRGSWR
ncbi:PREDICTED: protein MEI2-like 7 [Camelina sativa]|uniref:Protein MEI2-like 7 n=1 Tax=Camelina sativa TaxID=90675 RepID=A0ABM0VUQ1_CAMSA|nr:PREDICTED: protein MEI2-like 7 [Camelina sativa]